MKKILFITAFTIALSGCTIPIGLPKVMQAYGGPEKPSNQVAEIYVYDTYKNPSNLTETMWGAGVKAVNGISTEGYSRVTLLPGKHRLTMSCWNRNIKIRQVEKIDIDFNFSAGQRYYPWSKQLFPYNGTLVGKIDVDQCRPSLEPRMANQIR